MSSGNGMSLGFTVIDTKTGEYPDLWKIALEEEWAKGLMYCDMEGFAIGEDGTLILMDECGGQACCPEGRFVVVLEAGTGDPLTVEQLRERVQSPVWFVFTGQDGKTLKTYDIITKVTETHVETLRGEFLGLDGCGVRWFMYDREPVLYNGG